jgi:hypothetical protein
MNGSLRHLEELSNEEGGSPDMGVEDANWDRGKEAMGLRLDGVLA